MKNRTFGREYCYLLKTPPVRRLKITIMISDRYAPELFQSKHHCFKRMMAFWHAMHKTEGDNPKFRLLTFVDSIDSVWRITKNLDDAENNPRKQLFKSYSTGVGIARRTLLGTIIVRRLG